MGVCKPFPVNKVHQSDMMQLYYKTRIRSMKRGICPIAAVCTVVKILSLK